MTRPNFMLITADDMNWDAVGAFGCPTEVHAISPDFGAAQLSYAVRAKRAIRVAPRSRHWMI